MRHKYYKGGERAGRLACAWRLGGGVGIAWKRTGHRARREKKTSSNVRAPVLQVLGDTGKSHNSWFVLSVIGVSGATVTPEKTLFFADIWLEVEGN